MSKLFGLFAKKMKLPEVVGYLVTGLIIGPNLLGIVEESEVIKIMAEIGVILLMFNAGLETDLKVLKKNFKASLLVGAFGVVFTFVAIFFISKLFTNNQYESIFLGLVFMATSVSIAAQTLQELGKLSTKSGSTILSAAVIDDILGIILLTVIISFLGLAGSEGSSLIMTIIKILIFFIAIFVVGKLENKFFTWLHSKYGKLHRTSIFALGLCFLMSFFAKKLGLAEITGAFFMGLALSHTSPGDYIESKSLVLSYLFFTPMFFVSIGLNVTFSEFGIDSTIFILVMTLAIIGSKIFGAGLGSYISKYSFAESLRVGVGMGGLGEVSLILLNIGMFYGIISIKYNSPIVITIMLTALITPILLKLVYKDKFKKLK